MKVIHFVSGVKGGGVEQFLTNYTNFLNKKLSYDEIVVYQHEPEPVSLNKLRQAGNSCIRIADKRTHPFQNLHDTWKIIKREKPDIVHSHMSLLNFFPLIVAKCAGVKIRISHAHISMDNTNHKYLSQLFKKMNIFSATNLVACGFSAGRYMYGQKSFKVIRNAINIDKFLENDLDINQIKKALKIPQDAKVIGHVGRFVDQKNHHRLIRIFQDFQKNHPNTYLLLIGSGPLEEKIKEEVFNLNLSSKVIFLGSISKVEKYYQIMDLFLLPSFYEGLPIVAIEAQCSGVPMVMTDNIDNDSVLLATTRKVSLQSENSIWIKEIELLLNMKRVPKKKIRQIYIDKGFSINDSYSELADYYSKLMEGLGL